MLVKENSGLLSNSLDWEMTEEGTTASDDLKVFNDVVHGHISLPPLCCKIIDTPQFQRLRYIKQLGSVYYVYPGASHNRFEHCLGVCYLAGELVQSLQRRQPHLNISDRDVLCIQIGGLCHDLGHGPLSHLWEDFLNTINKASQKKYKHEEMSLHMFDHLLDENNLRKEFSSGEIKFIKDLITGRKGDRPSFYYQIISNGENGIDVDKWEYFARDSLHLNIKSCFDHRRVTEFCEVHEVNNEQHICYRDKEAKNIFEMFLIRASLHDKAYQHRVTKAVDQMIIEAFCLANTSLKVSGKNGRKYALSEAHKDVFAFEKLTDHILQEIIYSDRSSEEAKRIVQRLHKRELFSYVGTHNLTEPTMPQNIDDFCEAVWKCRLDKSHLRQEDLVACYTYFSFGKENQNPFDFIYFYDKSKERNISKKSIAEVSTFPIHYKQMETRHIVLFCKRAEAKDEAKAAFERWMKNIIPNNF